MDDVSKLLADLKAEGERTRSLNPLEVTDATKRFEKLLKTPEGKEAFRRVTGMRDAVFADEAVVQRERLPIVCVLVPCYAARIGKAWTAVEAMLMSSRGHCQAYVEPWVSSSVVHWTRNTHISRLLKTGKPFDYILFIDDDIEPPIDGLMKMLAHKKDVIAAACTVRQDPPKPNFRSWNPEDMKFYEILDWQREGLLDLQGGGAGTGMMLISHDCLKKVAEYYINCKYEQAYYGLSGERLDKLQAGRQEESKKTADFWWFEFLKHPFGHGEYGEDVSFCFKCRELGIPIYVDTTVRPKHIGDYGYCIDDFLDIRQDYKSMLAAKQPQAEIAVGDSLDAPMQEMSYI